VRYLKLVLNKHGERKSLGTVLGMNLPTEVVCSALELAALGPQ